MTPHRLYPDVYKPIRIGPVDIKNRLYHTPHGSISQMADPALGLRGHVYAADPVDGSPLPHPDVIDYYEERARGGLGLIIQGHIEVQKGDSGRWHLTTPSATAAFVPLLERVHGHGTKMFAQLHCGFGSASGIPGAGHVGEGIPRALTKEDIARIVGLVGLSATNARTAGFDGVELHAAHMHSTGIFLSGFTNRRTDEYGGSLENRMRFPVECLHAIRDAVGSSIAVGIRMPCDEQLPGGIDATEAQEIVRRLEDMGLVDFFDLGIGHSQAMWNVWGPHYLPASYEVPFIAKVRSVVRDAVVLGCPGRLNDPAEAQRILESGAMDMVGGARGLFADPEFPRKGLEVRAEEIRPCIGLNSCLYEGQCVMNPTNYLEALYGVTKMRPTTDPKRVLVIGGGPAGMEAARMAAVRGHDVTLMERAEALGGALNLQAELPTRDGVRRAPAWWGSRLDALGVKVLLGTDATVEEIVAHDADVTVMATGAAFETTGLNGQTGEAVPGWDRSFVYTPDTFLPAIPAVSTNVVIYEDDGALTASDIAWMMAERGAARVELVTRHPATSQSYIGHHGSHRDIVANRLYANGVQTSVETFIKEIGDHRVTLFNIYSKAERVIEDVELVVLVTLRRSNNQMLDELRARLPDVRVIGDAEAPGRMAKATRDGFFFGWNL